MIEVGDIVRLVTCDEHPYGSMLKPLLEKERGNLFVVKSRDPDLAVPIYRLDGSGGGTFLLERFNDDRPFHPGKVIHTVWEGWIKKDEFLTAVKRAVRLDPDVVDQGVEQEVK